MNFSTSSQPKQANSFQQPTPHSVNILAISDSTSSPGKPNNLIMEAIIVAGSAGTFLGVISFDSKSEDESPTVDDLFGDEDITINEYAG